MDVTWLSNCSLWKSVSSIVDEKNEKYFSSSWYFIFVCWNVANRVTNNFIYVQRMSMLVFQRTVCTWNFIHNMLDKEGSTLIERQQWKRRKNGRILIQKEADWTIWRGFMSA